MYRFAFCLSLIAFLFSSCARRNEIGTERKPENLPGGVPVAVSSPESDAAEPAIATDGEGNIYIAYVEHYPDKTADVFLRKYDKDLKPAGEKVRINPVAGTAKAWRGDPPAVTVSTDGTLYIAWIVKVDSAEKTAADDLVVSASRDRGASFTAPVRVNDAPESAAYGMVSLISDTGGQLGIAWLDERNVKAGSGHDGPARPAAAMIFHHKEEVEPNRDVFFAASADGGRTFSANKKIASDACPCCKTSMAAAPDGRIYVSWRQVLPGGYRHIAVASSSDKGATFSRGAVVSDDKWQINACPVSGASLAAGNDGMLSVLWYSAGEAGEAGVYSAESRDGGKTFGPRREISAEGVSGTPVLLAGGAGMLPVFAAKENRVVVEKGPPGNALSIPDASLPAAALTNSNSYIAFVRTAGEKRSVWLTRA